MALPKLIYTAAVPESLLAFRVDIIKILSEEFEVIVLSSNRPALRELENKTGARSIVVNIERRPSIFKDIVSLVKLIRVFRKEKPLIVHSMSAKCGLVSMMAAKIAGVPHRVHSFTGLAFPTATGLSRKILITTEKLTCMAANHLLPEGNGVKGALQEYITKKKMTVLGYGNIRGIDLAYYDRTPEVMEAALKIRKQEAFTFVFVGRIVRDKGINELVAAFKKLYSSHPEVRLILVGPYEDDIDPISQEAREAVNSYNDIMTVGKKTGVELLSYYAASDCFVFPSYREGFPNVVIEAGAMGLPSVVTDIFGSNEIIQEGKNGLIVPPRDEEALYTAMKRMVEDNGLRNELTSNAREMIALRYEESYVRGCLIDYYHQIMKEKE